LEFLEDRVDVSNRTLWITHATLLAIAAIFMCVASFFANAATTDDLSREARATLDNLYRTNETAAAMGRSARSRSLSLVETGSTAGSLAGAV
jgi:hypothetical protein